MVLAIALGVAGHVDGAATVAFDPEVVRVGGFEDPHVVPLPVGEALVQPDAQGRQLGVAVEDQRGGAGGVPGAAAAVLGEQFVPMQAGGAVAVHVLLDGGAVLAAQFRGIGKAGLGRGSGHAQVPLGTFRWPNRSALKDTFMTATASGRGLYNGPVPRELGLNGKHYVISNTVRSQRDLVFLLRRTFWRGFIQGGDWKS